MKTIRSIFLWPFGLLHFCLMFIILGLGLLFFPGKALFPAVRFLFRVQLLAVGVRLKVLGREHVNPRKTYLILGNHQSLFDAFAIPAALPMHAVAMEAAYHFSLPMWGFLARKWGNIPAHRRDRRKAIHTLRETVKIIQSGTSIVILPEGHRTLTGDMAEFKKGPFHLALAAKADILPFAISGLYEFKSKNSWHLNPCPVSLRFGRPIAHASFKNQTVDELRDRVRNAVLELTRMPD